MGTDNTNTIFREKHPSNRRGIILMYHRVIKSNYDPRRLCVSPAHFEEHVRIIKKYGRSVQMREMVEDHGQELLVANTITITLDDGYSDNYRCAKPVLERFNVPATFFIITGAIGGREEFFRDSLEQIILAPLTLPQNLDIVIGGTQYRWRVKNEGPCVNVDYAAVTEKLPETGAVLSRSGLYLVLTQLIGVLTGDERKYVLARLAAWSGSGFKTRPDNLPMTADELISLAENSLFEIGSHTVNHPHLARLNAREQADEISQSKRDLEGLTGQTVDSFCYPHGNYSQETVDIVEQSGYRAACTVRARPVDLDTNPFLLPRFMVMDWDGTEFEQKLQKWLARD